MALTMKKLQRFVKARRKSGFNSNMQFQIDANDCGFSVADLGEIEKFDIDGFAAYQWKPTIKEISGRHALPVEKTIRLVEFGRWIYLEGEDFPEATRMFEMMKTATPVPLEKK